MVGRLFTRTLFPMLFLCAAMVVWQKDLLVNGSPAVIRIGILHSSTGTMAGSEAPLIQAVEMAVQELNNSGGLLGRKIETVTVNPNSDTDQFAALAESLIVHEKVEAIFGCWTSSSRKQVRPIMEKYQSILFYPVQYEGLESSPNIVYTGASPNQQILPTLTWAVQNLGTRFYVVGSDYVFPRIASVMIRDHLSFLGAELVGESYIILGGDEVSSIVEAIKTARPDVIINTLNGSTNQAFFNEMRDSGIRSDDIPTISFSVSESELSSFPSENIVGDYLAWSYFQSKDTAENRDFVRRFRQLYGESGAISGPMVASYFGVLLWASAVTAGESPESLAVLAHLPDRSVTAPGGLVYLDKSNHTWLPSLIGKISDDRSVEIVWESEYLIRPVLFPPTRTRQQWTDLLNGLQMEWNGRWQNYLRTGTGS